MTLAEQREIVTDGIILALFRQGFDTRDIASKIGCNEAQVYNRLSRARKAAHP